MEWFDGEASHHRVHFMGMPDIVGFSETDVRPIAEIYSVFSRPAKRADRRARRVAERWGALDFGLDFEGGKPPPPPPDVLPEDWEAFQPGAVLNERGRLLFAGLGGDWDMLYAAPTENDHICYALLPNGGGGCTQPGPQGLVVAGTGSPSRGALVFGLVGDEVEALDLVVSGQLHSARMGENSFAVALPESFAEIDRILLRRRDGSTVEL